MRRYPRGGNSRGLPAVSNAREVGSAAVARSSGAAYESVKNPPPASAPKARMPARLDRSNAAMSAVVQLPRRIQMTLGGGPRTKLTWWKSESFDTMLSLCSRAYVQIAASVARAKPTSRTMDGPREYVGKVGD